MALNIKRKETERLARVMSQRTGLSVTATIEAALERWQDQLNRESGDSGKALADFIAWQESLGPRPPGPSYQEIIEDMYDEHGLPR